MSGHKPFKKRHRDAIDLGNNNDDEVEVLSVADDDDDSSVDLGPLPTPSSDEESDGDYDTDEEDLILSATVVHSQDTMSSTEEGLLATQPRSYKAKLNTSPSRIIRRGTPRPKKRQATTPESLTLSETQSVNSDAYGLAAIAREATPVPKRSSSSKSQKKTSSSSPRKASIKSKADENVNSDVYGLNPFAREATPVPAPKKQTTSPKLKEKSLSSPTKTSNKSTKDEPVKKKKKDKAKAEKGKVEKVKKNSTKSSKKKSSARKASEAAPISVLESASQQKPSPKAKENLDAKKSATKKTAKLDAEPVKKAKVTRTSPVKDGAKVKGETKPVTTDPASNKKSAAPKPAAETKAAAEDTAKKCQSSSNATASSASVATTSAGSTSKPAHKPVKRKRKVAKHQTPPTTSNDGGQAPSKKLKETKPPSANVKTTECEPVVKPTNDENKKPENHQTGTQSDLKAKQKIASKTTPKSVDRKPKPKKRTFQGDVLFHMFMSCKPFTLKTLAQELKTTEAALNHLMLSLLDKQIVLKKEFATKKTTKVLYWANQESKAKEATAFQINPQEMHEARQELDRLAKQDASISRELAVVMQEASNQDLLEQLKREEEEVQALERKVAEVKARIKAPPPPVRKPLNMRGSNQKSAAQLAKERDPRRLKMRINAMRNEWKTRKEKCSDFVDQLADGMEKKVKDVVKILDIDTDEAEGVTMPPKYAIDTK